MINGIVTHILDERYLNQAPCVPVPEGHVNSEWNRLVRGNHCQARAICPVLERKTERADTSLVVAY